MESFAACEHQCLQWFDYWRSSIADVPRCGLFQAWRLDRSCPDELLQLIQTNCLAYIELQQHQHGPVKHPFGGLDGGIRHNESILRPDICLLYVLEFEADAVPSSTWHAKPQKTSA